jgi:hypothetical protein
MENTATIVINATYYNVRIKYGFLIWIAKRKKEIKEWVLVKLWLNSNTTKDGRNLVSTNNNAMDFRLGDSRCLINCKTIE